MDWFLYDRDRHHEWSNHGYHGIMEITLFETCKRKMEASIQVC